MTTLSVVQGANTSASADGGAAHPEATFNIGTRKSKLALVQTDLVVKALASAYPDNVYTIKARDTAAGDVDKVTPFKDMAVKNLWTHELETLMVEGQLDILVHSLKDVPTQLPAGCEIGAVLPREDPRDAFVLKAGRNPCKIQDLPAGSVIGTSSVRRTAQIALLYPHLRVEDVRGNVNTRLSKLDAEGSSFDALILAAAGLIRIDLGHRITQYLDSENGGMLYAVGQGAIGVENRSPDDRVQRILSAIDHHETHLAAATERSLLRTLEGGCSAPLGVETSWVKNPNGQTALRLKSIVVSTDGKAKSEIDLTEVVASKNDAESFGIKAASELLRRGADSILAEIKAKKPTTAADLEEN
ncbi:porphobilinogen deaminase [Capronia epimyces CBS 606.96]|uniref:hydroxymethylbilane synthase n=1 Tax=Capronia epimyces CBS 606.96 TaxID=1182542 RepID=W9Y438_9EURO|nr:porphobilinogen deaminase [Capronia epimyces CBS 606.96]EXJ84390.1 porphobilinogen deaminase [Capronia epimyces CBS 606.96]